MALAMNLLIGLVTYFIAFFLTLLFGVASSDPKKSGMIFILGGIVIYTLIFFNTVIEYGEILYVLFMLINILLGTRSMKPKRQTGTIKIPEVPQQVGYVPVTHPIIHAMMKRLSIPQTFRLVGPYIYLSDDNSVLIYVHPDNPLQPSKFTLSAHKFFWLVHVAPMPKDVPVPNLSSNMRVIIQHYPGPALLRWIDEKLANLKSELREVEELAVRVTRRENPDLYVSTRTRKIQLQADIRKLEELRRKLGSGIIRIILLDVWSGPVELVRFDHNVFESHIRHLVAQIQAAEQQLMGIAAQEGYIVINVVGPQALEEAMTFQAGVDVIPSFIENYLDKLVVGGDSEKIGRELWEKLAEVLKSSQLGIEKVDLTYAATPPRIDNIRDALQRGIIPVAISVDPKTGQALGPEYSVWFDFSDTSKARHIIIAGGTGSGKSFAAKTIITWLAFARPDMRIFIFDDGTYSGLAKKFDDPKLFEAVGLPPEARRGFKVKLWVVGENLLLNILRRPQIDSKELLQAEAGVLVKKLLDIIGSKSKTLQNALFEAIMYFWTKGEDADLDKVLDYIKKNVKGRGAQTIMNEVTGLLAYKIIMHPQGITKFDQLFEGDVQIALFRAEGISDEVRALIASILIEWSREWLKELGPTRTNRLLLVIDEAFANFKKIMRNVEKWIVEARKYGGIGLFISQRIIAHFPPGVRQQATGYIITFKGAEKEVVEFGVDKELQNLVREGAKHHIALIISPIGLLKNPVLARFLPPLASHSKAPDKVEEQLMGMIFKSEPEVAKREEPLIVTSGWRTIFRNEDELIKAIKMTSEGVGFRRLARILRHDTPWRIRRWHEAFKILLSRRYSVSEIAELLINNSEITAMELLEFARRVSNKTSGKRLVDLYAVEKAKND